MFYDFFNGFSRRRRRRREENEKEVEEEEGKWLQKGNKTCNKAATTQTGPYP